MLDPRLHPYRSDLAAAHLKGLVSAPSFTKGCGRIVRCGLAALRRGPQENAEQVNEIRYGEAFTVYEEKNGWAWGQAGRDGYVGYLHSAALGNEAAPPTHIIKVASSFLFSLPSIKAPPLALLTYLSPVALTGRGEGLFAEVAGGGFVHAAHVLPTGEYPEGDVVAAAGRFLGAPYLWGGVSPLGCDCSGLVQSAFAAVGRMAPRDSDMQAGALGQPVPKGSNGHTAFQRCDLVFFPGHVGLMADEKNMIHANAHHGRVVVEPLADVVARGSGITAVRRP